jgi:hypothetical protein
LLNEPMVARQEGRLDGYLEGPFKRGWKVALLSGFSGPVLGNYVVIPSELGGQAGLRKSVADLRTAGGRVLLVLDGAHVSKESSIGKADGQGWAVRTEDRHPVEDAGNWVLCPANPAWRDWLIKIALKLARTYGVDGIAIAGLSGQNAYACHSKSHGHTSPYVWSWGTRRLFSDLRERLNRNAPDALLVSVGVLDSVREFADAMVAETHAQTGYRFEFPLLKTTVPAIRIYENAAASEPELAEQLRTWNLVQSIPSYAPNVQATEGPLPNRRLFETFPRLMDATLMDAAVATPSRDLVARLLFTDEYLLAVGNLSGEPFTGPIRLPYKVAALEDPLTGLKLEPDSPGVFSLALLPRQGAIWRVVPLPSTGP